MFYEISLLQTRRIRNARLLCNEADLSVKNLINSPNIVYFNSFFTTTI